MASGLLPVPADIHRTPLAIFPWAFIHEQPSAIVARAHPNAAAFIRVEQQGNGRERYPGCELRAGKGIDLGKQPIDGLDIRLGPFWSNENASDIGPEGKEVVERLGFQCLLNSGRSRPYFDITPLVELFMFDGIVDRPIRRVGEIER
ncbi:hypothetical protein [Mesorhizobium sp. RMAD-H1]|uniref:hypothetical protein n=1 Tax=Mesorhizobium sp. RMAD-H1 TaxID=2587065 RepID=UPI001FF0667E|nr:hypothetical protein [Mesorhizobium sp. RMAD-H1]